MQIHELTYSEAKVIYDQLPIEKQITSLSPEYVRLDASREADCEPLYLSYKGSQGIGIYSCVKKKAKVNSECYVVQNPYSYGGELTSSRNLYHEFRRELDRWFKSNNVIAETIGRHPILFQTYDQSYQSSKIIKLPQKQCIAIDFCDHNWSDYTSRCRNSIRKGMRYGYSCEVLNSSENLDAFMTMYYAAMKKIQASQFYFFKRNYFENLMSFENCILIVCKQNEVWHSAALFLLADLYAEYHLAATTLDGRNNGATNILIDFAAKYFAEKKSKIFYLGGGVTSKSNDPLLKFKSSFSNNKIYYSREFRIHDQCFIRDEMYKFLPIFDGLELFLESKN